MIKIDPSQRSGTLYANLNEVCCSAGHKDAEHIYLYYPNQK